MSGNVIFFLYLQSWKKLLERLAVIMCIFSPRSPNSMLRPGIGLVSMPEGFNIVWWGKGKGELQLYMSSLHFDILTPIHAMWKKLRSYFLTRVNRSISFFPGLWTGCSNCIMSLFSFCHNSKNMYCMNSIFYMV